MSDKITHAPNSLHGTTCYPNSVHPIVGAVLFDFALSSAKVVKVTSVIRNESYFNVIINTNYLSNNSPCEMEVSFQGTGTKKILPLQGKILLYKADRYDLFK